MTVAPKTTLAAGSFPPSASAMPVLTTPATSPFHIAICEGSLPETFRVRLLSMPQQRQAAAIRIAPGEIANFWPVGSESRMPPNRISANPKTIRLSTFSRKTIRAMTAVATASRFSSRDAALAGVVIRPSRRKIGPTTPPVRMAPASQGTSSREMGVSFCPIPDDNRIARRTASPKPEPRYRSPAISTGSAAEMASLAKGVLAPKSNAAAIALVIPLRGKVCLIIFPDRLPPLLDPVYLLPELRPQTSRRFNDPFQQQSFRTV